MLNRVLSALCKHRVNPIDRLSAKFDNFKLFTPLTIHFQLNLNTSTDRVNSLIVVTWSNTSMNVSLVVYIHRCAWLSLLIHAPPDDWEAITLVSRCYDQYIQITRLSQVSSTHAKIVTYTHYFVNIISISGSAESLRYVMFIFLYISQSNVIALLLRDFLCQLFYVSCRSYRRPACKTSVVHFDKTIICLKTL